MRRWTHIVLVVAACSPAASGETDGAGSSTTVDASTTGAPTTGGGPADLPPIDPCLDGDVFVATQEELDALAGCVEIPGKLTIVGDQIGSLAALSELRVIGGGLFIGRDGGVLTTPRITSLAGLEGLESVPSVGLAWLDQLSNVEALAGHTAVPGELSLYQLPKLAALEGLHNVESVDSLSISACPSLVDLSGVTVMDSLGFAMLVRLAKRNRRLGLPVVVVLGNTTVARLVGLARLDRILWVSITRATARAALGLPGPPPEAA